MHLFIICFQHSYKGLQDINQFTTILLGLLHQTTDWAIVISGSESLNLILVIVVCSDTGMKALLESNPISADFLQSFLSYTRRTKVPNFVNQKQQKIVNNTRQHTKIPWQIDKRENCSTRNCVKFVSFQYIVTPFSAH